MQYPNKAFVSTLCWSVTAEVIWVRVKWGKVWSQSFTLWLTLRWRDTSVRLCSRPSSSSSATTFDKSLSATNFAQAPKLLTLQPLEAGGGVSALSRRDSRLPRGSLVAEEKSTWFSGARGDQSLSSETAEDQTAGRAGRLLFVGVLRAALGCLMVLAVENGGFTSAVIFEVKRRGGFAQDFLRWEDCHPNFSYHAH